MYVDYVKPSNTIVTGSYIHTGGNPPKLTGRVIRQMAALRQIMGYIGNRNLSSYIKMRASHKSFTPTCLQQHTTSGRVAKLRTNTLSQH